MKYILMMNATKADFDWYAKWPKEDLQANFAFMHAFNKELKDSGVLVATEGLAWPDQVKIVRAGSDGAAYSLETTKVRLVTTGRRQAKQGACLSATTFSLRPRDFRANMTSALGKDLRVEILG